jgi:hypothetical protein
MAVVDVFQGGRLFEAGLAQPGGNGSVFAPQPLRIDQPSQPLLEAEGSRLGLLQLLAESLSHTVELQAVEFFEGLFTEHQSTSAGR